MQPQELNIYFLTNMLNFWNGIGGEEVSQWCTPAQVLAQPQKPPPPHPDSQWAPSSQASLLPSLVVLESPQLVLHLFWPIKQDSQA